MDLDISTPRDWPNHVKEFMALEQLLRCEICFDFFTNCMMTQCAHNFCSLCIRKHLRLKPICPTCYQDAYEPALRKNRIVDEVIQNFCAARSKLIETLRQSKPSQKQNEANESTFKYGTTLVLNANIKKNSEKDAEEGEFIFKAANMPGGTNLNEAPLCKKVCLSLNSKSCQKTDTSKRQYLSKIVYHLMKIKDIKECLSKAGLSTRGKREDLIERHKQFVVMYNAECDAENPRPVAEIIKELEQEEKHRKTPEKIFTTNRNSEPDAIEEERCNYVAENKGHFDILVAEAHKTKQKKCDSSHTGADDTQVEPSSSNDNIQDTAIVISSDSDSDFPSLGGITSRSDSDSDSTVVFGALSPPESLLLQPWQSGSCEETETRCAKNSDSESTCSTIDINVLSSCDQTSKISIFHSDALTVSENDASFTRRNSADDSERRTPRRPLLSLRKRGLSNKRLNESSSGT